MKDQNKKQPESEPEIKPVVKKPKDKFTPEEDKLTNDMIKDATKDLGNLFDGFTEDIISQTEEVKEDKKDLNKDQRYNFE